MLSSVKESSHITRSSVPKYPKLYKLNDLSLCFLIGIYRSKIRDWSKLKLDRWSTAKIWRASMRLSQLNCPNCRTQPLLRTHQPQASQSMRSLNRREMRLETVRSSSPQQGKRRCSTSKLIMCLARSPGNKRVSSACVKSAKTKVSSKLVLMFLSTISILRQMKRKRLLCTWCSSLNLVKFRSTNIKILSRDICLIRKSSALAATRSSTTGILSRASWVSRTWRAWPKPTEASTECVQI